MPPFHHCSSSSHLPSGHDPNRVRLASLYFYLFIFDLIGLLRTRLCYGLIVYFHLNSFERELLCPIALPPCHQGIVFPIKVFKKLHPSSQLPINQNEREREIDFLSAAPPLHCRSSSSTLSGVHGLDLVRLTSLSLLLIYYFLWFNWFVENNIVLLFDWTFVQFVAIENLR